MTVVSLVVGLLDGSELTEKQASLKTDTFLNHSFT